MSDFQFIGFAGMFGGLFSILLLILSELRQIKAKIGGGNAQKRK